MFKSNNKKNKALLPTAGTITFLIIMLLMLVFIFTGCRDSLGDLNNSSIDTENTSSGQNQVETAVNSDGADNSGSTEVTIERKVLIAGSDTSYPPFEFIQDGVVTGFDIDLINEIFIRIDKEIIIQPFSWDPDFKLLREGELDLIISSVSYNEEKENLVDFSKPYYNMHFLLFTLLGSDVNTREKITGGNVGLLESAGSSLDEEYLSDFEIREYKDVIELLDGLKKKEVDAVILSVPVAVNLLKENRDIYFVIEEIESSREFVIVLENNSILKQPIDSAIDSIMGDGAYDTIYRKWFDFNSQ